MKSKITAYICGILLCTLVWACTASALATAPCAGILPGSSRLGKPEISDPGMPFQNLEKKQHNVVFYCQAHRQTSSIIIIMLSTTLDLFPGVGMAQNGKSLVGKSLWQLFQPGTGWAWHLEVQSHNISAW